MKDTCDISHSVILPHLKLRARLPKHIWYFLDLVKWQLFKGSAQYGTE